MRNNLPVTGREYDYRDDAVLISATDDKGLITQANRDFVEVSGFAREELVGQPHNIVRHPDMPSEAFRDLWDTIKRGRPWSGLVKNRRKSGDHYWVRATVTPHKGGYLSVRYKPTREEIRRAEDMYGAMRADPGMRLREGRPAPTGLAAVWDRMFGGWHVSTRLWVMASFGLILFLAAMVVGWVSVSRSIGDMRSVYEDRAAPMYDLARIGMLMKDNRTEVLLGFQHDPNGPTFAFHDHPLGAHTEAVAKRKAEIEETWARFRRAHTADDEKPLIEDFEKKMRAWDAQVERAISAMQRGQFDAVTLQAFLLAGRTEGAAATQSLEALIAYQAEHAKQRHADAVAWGEKVSAAYAVMLLVGLVGLLVMTYMTIAHITISLRSAGELAAAITSGDLTKEVMATGSDEIGDLLASMASMRNTLHALVASISQAIQRMRYVASEMSEAAAAGSDTAEKQSEVASGIAASVEELSVSVDQIEEHAREARGVAEASHGQAANGGRIIHDVVEEMRRIEHAVKHAASGISDMQKRSEQISAIAHVIDEIADQTNLLALNAAIEAARAGEHGRGFSVVADEVRKLAERTSKSTHEISEMIAAIQHGMAKAVDEMMRCVAMVDEGVRLAQQSGDAVTLIRDGAQNAMRAVDDIGHALKEQSAATRDIAQKIERIAHESEQGSATIARVADVARQVQDMVAALQSIVSGFRLR